MLRKVIPSKVRIACFIIIIATFVTVVELVMQAFTYPLFLKLGIFIPLIVVNCIVLGRAEAFASKNSVIRSTLDGLGIGIGFTLALAALGTVRELARQRHPDDLGKADSDLGALISTLRVCYSRPLGLLFALDLMLCIMNLLGKK